MFRYVPDLHGYASNSERYLRAGCGVVQDRGNKHFKIVLFKALSFVFPNLPAYNPLCDITKHIYKMSCPSNQPNYDSQPKKSKKMHRWRVSGLLSRPTCMIIASNVLIDNVG